MRVMKPTLYLLTIAIIIAGCYRPSRGYTTGDYYPSKVIGYKPVYSQNISDLKVFLDTPRTMKSAGKIYVKDKYIYQADEGTGIHVFDKSVPSQLRPVGFINVNGLTELSITGNHLFVNSDADLIVLDISDLQNPKAISRVAGAFWQGASHSSYSPSVPLPEHEVYFDCVNSAEGILVGWKKDSVYQSCYYP